MEEVAQPLVVVAALLLFDAVGAFIFRRTGIPDVVRQVGVGTCFRGAGRDPRYEHLAQGVLDVEHRDTVGIGGPVAVGASRLWRCYRRRFTPGGFAFIVSSILIFAIGFAIVKRMPAVANPDAN